ncbi:MAG TPA: glycosyltransferase [Burkholderiales bacterium]|nr:glycosyltransferase [Burkholderiales bacterium]
MKVSVIMPCYNGGTFLESAVRSALAQENCEWEVEVMVINDHSDDAYTLELMDQLAKLPGVRVVSNTGNRGIAAGRNFGMAASDADWFAFLDGDDLWLPHSMQARIEAWKLFPQAEILSGDHAIFNGEIPQEPEPFVAARLNRYANVASAFKSGRPIGLSKPVDLFVGAIPMWVGTVIIKRSVFEKVGVFDEQLRRAQDVNMWLRASRVADVAFTPRIVALYRQHAGAITAEEGPPGKGSALSYQKLHDMPEFAAHRKALRRVIGYSHNRDAVYYRRRGRYAEAVKASLRGLRADLRNPLIWKNLAASVVRR